jgi:hypothetical protein
VTLATVAAVLGHALVSAPLGLAALALLGSTLADASVAVGVVERTCTRPRRRQVGLRLEPAEAEES